MVFIWAFGQVYPEYNHRLLTDDEFTTAQNQRFYPVDELKYHGSHDHRGMITINFFEAGTNFNEHTRNYVLLTESKAALKFCSNCVVSLNRLKLNF